MSVNPRGSSWQATVHHQGERYRRDFETKVDALAWEAATRASLLRGEVPSDLRQTASDGSPATMQALLDMTYARYWRGRPAGDTALLNGSHVVTLLGAGLQPSKITERMIDSLILALQSKGNSNGTVNRKLAALSKMLTFASDRGFIQRKPKIERLKEAEGRLRWVSDEEEKELLTFFQHIGADDMRDFCVVCFDTGMRTGEALAFTAGQVQGSGLLLYARQTKAGKARSVPLTGRALAVVQRRVEDRRKGPVFTPLTQSAVNHYWNRARAHMGLDKDEEFVPHLMRHTFCSRLAQRGANAVVIKDLAGHSSLQVTQRYMKLAPANLVSAIALLEQTPA